MACQFKGVPVEVTDVSEGIKHFYAGIMEHMGWGGGGAKDGLRVRKSFMRPMLNMLKTKRNTTHSMSIYILEIIKGINPLTSFLLQSLPLKPLKKRNEQTCP